MIRQLESALGSNAATPILPKAPPAFSVDRSPSYLLGWALARPMVAARKAVVEKDSMATDGEETVSV